MLLFLSMMAGLVMAAPVVGAPVPQQQAPPLEEEEEEEEKLERGDEDGGDEDEESAPGGRGGRGPAPKLESSPWQLNGGGNHGKWGGNCSYLLYLY